jgi:hypothetical protein
VSTEAPSGHLSASWGNQRARTRRPVPATARTAPYDITLDWRHCRVSQHPRPCRICRRGALMLDPDDQPCHKTCAESELVRTRGVAGARAVVAATFRPRAGKKVGS